MLDGISGAFPPFCWRKTNTDCPELKRQEEGEMNPLHKAETLASGVQLQWIGKKKIEF